METDLLSLVPTVNTPHTRWKSPLCFDELIKNKFCGAIKAFKDYNGIMNGQSGSDNGMLATELLGATIPVRLPKLICYLSGVSDSS